VALLDASTRTESLFGQGSGEVHMCDDMPDMEISHIQGFSMVFSGILLFEYIYEVGWGGEDFRF